MAGSETFERISASQEFKTHSDTVEWGFSAIVQKSSGCLGETADVNFAEGFINGHVHHF
jgi:hypothetical protein